MKRKLSAPSRPPGPARWILRTAAPAHVRDRLLGDLEEIYAARTEESGPRLARLWYWAHALSSLPSLAWERLFWRLMLLNNYARIAFRNIRKQKVFSAINIVGFAFSLALGLLIIEILGTIYGADRFHDKGDRIYRVTSLMKQGEKRHDMATAPLPLGPELAQLPGVEAVLRIKKGFGGDVIQGDKIIPIEGLYADGNFFNFFSFRLKRGDTVMALAEPYSVVITPELAAKFFPDRDPLGQTLNVKDLGDFRVMGILEDVSRLRTSLKFDCLASASTLAPLEAAGKIKKSLERWTDFNFGYVYFLLREKASPGAVLSVLPAIAKKNIAIPNLSVTFSLQALKDISSGREMSNELHIVMPPILVGNLVLVGILVTLIACFNYANLSVAKTLSRAREVGIRKVLGASRSHLMTQFVGEAVVISFLSLFLAYFLLQVLISLFSNLHGKISSVISLQPWSLDLFPAFALFAVFTGLLAGLFPSFILARLNAATVLKDVTKARRTSRLSLRKALTVGQFFFSLVTLTLSLIVAGQVRYLKSCDYGFRYKGIVNVELQGESYEIFRQACLRDPRIRGISASAVVPNTGVTWYESAKVEGRAEAADMAMLFIDDSFLSNLEIGLAVGRDFPADVWGPGEKYILLNETAVRAFGFGTPSEALGKTVAFGDGPPLPVIGVVRDFGFSNPSTPIEPLILRFVPKNFGYANLRISADSAEEVLRSVQANWKSLHPFKNFKSSFYEDEIRQSLFGFETILTALGFVSFLTVFISLLGLLGMVVFEVEAKVKDIGIRRVLGGTSRRIVLGMSAKFVRPLLWAAGFGLPAAWVVGGMFLRTFAFRIALGPGYFLLGFSLLFAAALAIVLSQTVRATRVNPVECLRNE